LRRAGIVVGLLCALFLAARVRSAAAEEEQPTYPVGIRQIEFFDGSRYFALAVFYPADLPDTSAPSFNLPFFVNLHLYKDAEIPKESFRW
jgi:hypothetical protein